MPKTWFGPGSLAFLKGLKKNNRREWFEPRKPEYQREVLDPLRAVAEELDVRFARLAPEFEANPKRSLFRIYRDVRFSKDKSPYKTHLAASFPWVSADGSWDRGEGGVGGYFHFQPGEMYLGGGMWHPEPARLAAWRAHVMADRGGVHTAIEDPRFLKAFGPVEGERTKRVPAGVFADDPDVELLKLKQVLFGRRLSDADVQSSRLPVLMADSFATAVPVMRLLASLSA